MKAPGPDATKRPVAAGLENPATELAGIRAWLVKMENLGAVGPLLGVDKQRRYYAARAVYLVCRLVERIGQGM